MCRSEFKREKNARHNTPKASTLYLIVGLAKVIKVINAIILITILCSTIALYIRCKIIEGLSRLRSGAGDLIVDAVVRATIVI